MRIQERGNLFRCVEIDRLVEISGDGGSILALEMHIFDLGQPQLRNERIIGLGQTSKIAAVL